MLRKTEIEAKIAALQAELFILNNAPEDIYSFGTVAVIASNTTKSYLRKVGEEKWVNIKSSTENDLASWILNYRESDIGYFEIYIMTAAETPIYASS